MKLAIFILSDPDGGDDALGRLYNGLALAAEAREKRDDVAVVFAASGTRWPAELSKLGHPARALYESVRDSVQGASCACAEVFGATAGVESAGVSLLTDNAVPATSGLASIRGYVASGYTPLLF